MDNQEVPKIDSWEIEITFSMQGRQFKALQQEVQVSVWETTDGMFKWVGAAFSEPTDQAFAIILKAAKVVQKASVTAKQIQP